jgi:hypothetical protein
MDSIGSGVCRAQESYFHSRPADSGRDAEDCENVAAMGVGYRQAQAEEHLILACSMHPGKYQYQNGYKFFIDGWRMIYSIAYSGR